MWTISLILLKFMSIESMMPSNLIPCIPFLYPQSFPTWRSFPVTQFFASGGQSIRASTSASVLPTNMQGWFLWRLIGLISLLSPWSQVSSSAPQFDGIHFLVLSHVYSWALTSVHGYWKNHSFGSWDLCRQSNVCFLIGCLGLSLFSSNKQVFF